MEKEIKEAVYQATYDAWMAAFGAEGNRYPITTEALHEVIGRAIESALSNQHGTMLDDKTTN